MIGSPLSLAGIKTPTNEILGIELTIPVKQTMKGNYQSVMAPVEEISKRAQLMNGSSGGKKKTLKKKDVSRNEHLSRNQSNTNKSHQTTLSLVNV